MGIVRRNFMKEMMSFEWLVYGGNSVMGLSVFLFVVQTVLFAVRRKNISRNMDEEYGQPQKYHSGESAE